MAKIEIYARVRPTGRPYSGIQISTNPDSGCEHIKIETGDSGDRLTTPSRYNRPHNSQHSFQFKRVFGETTTQEEVFETVSRHIIDSFLGGYNGTVFAYGQTSSGKTHTIEGSGRKFIDRGIIPRALSYIYREVEKRTEKGEEVNIHISYMEIYQDTGYDLLNPGMRPGALMVTLPKINIAEGPGGEVVVRNLSTHLAATEEVAQSLLFQGSTCRKVAETSMNQCSSRSHSIFSITLTAKAADSEIITKSKLNLVDLAGSERVAKTGADGRILQEAKYINLSLHHLEHVIVALQHQLKNSSASPSTSHSGTSLSAKKSREREHTNSPQQSPHTPIHRSGTSRGGQTPSRSSLRPGTRGSHIPYRNCMLTMVLKDSLGGNCLTAMIATVSTEEENVWETISTCRFSQRVACISNKARKNEELDDKVVIRKLKQRIAQLEQEVSALREQTAQLPARSDSSLSSSLSLTPAEKVLCHQILHGFFHGKIDSPVAAGVDTAAKFQECLKVLKMIVLQALGINSQTKSPSAQQNEVTAHASELASQVKDSLQSSTATPSPNSRLSSGFGSFVDEDGITTCESSHNEEVLKEGQLSSPHMTVNSPQPVEKVTSVRDQLREQRKYHEEQKHRSTREHHNKVMSSGGSKPHEQDTCKSHIHVKDPDSKPATKLSSTIKDPVSPIQSDHSPKHRGRAWMSPVTSPTTSSDKSGSFIQTPVPPIQTLDSFDSRHSAKFNQSSALSVKPLSPREEKAVHKLAAKQAELERSRCEQKKLATKVQLLDLHVEEEKIKSELQQISEQLASQHVHVSLLQKIQSDSEQLCAERIAEQQLRIKQAKIHQRLMDIQYRIRNSSNQQGRESGVGHPVATAIFPNSGPNVQSSPSPVKSPKHYHVHVPSNRIQNELEKHKMKQTQVQDQIEKLRISQMEKQLELKEASTRRKILALKQQLMGDKNPVHSPASVQTHTSTKTHLQPSNQPERRQAPLTAPLPDVSHATRDKEISKSKSDHLTTSINGGLKLMQQDHNTYSSTYRAFSTKTDSTTVLAQPPNNMGIRILALHDDQQPQTSTHFQPLSTISTYEPHPVKVDDSKQLRYTVSPTVQIGSSLTEKQNKRTPESLASPIAQVQRIQYSSLPKDNTAKAISNIPSKGSSQQFSKPSVSKNARTKLTLPEEIKETEYMTALQRQKARVSRIRRCIIAATVIQRTWRKYRDSLKS